MSLITSQIIRKSPNYSLSYLTKKSFYPGPCSFGLLLVVFPLFKIFDSSFRMNIDALRIEREFMDFLYTYAPKINPRLDIFKY